MSAQLRAGAARCVISPPRGIFLIGYGDRFTGNTGTHDDLYATVLVLDDGRTRLAIVALDMLAINEFIVDRVRLRLAPCECLLCCSHTHSGPIAYAGEESPRKNQAYIDSLVDNIVEAVRRAEKDLLPARLEFSHGEGEVGINRRQQMPDGRVKLGRNPAGPRDSSMQVVSVFADSPAGEPKGRRLATLVNYACHGTVLGPLNLRVSADWIGVMRDRVEREFGGLVLFLQGAAADINPDISWKVRHAFEKVAEQGSRVAGSVLAAITGGSEQIQGLPLRVERVDAWLPTEMRATTPHPPRDYGPKLLSLPKLPGFMTAFVDLLLDKLYPWKPVIESKDGYWSVPMRISAVRIGELALVTFAAETFTGIGTKLKAASPAGHTLFASLTDGCISYLYTEESHPQGGYEVDLAPLPYRYPGRLQASCERIALDAAGGLLSSLWA